MKKIMILMWVCVYTYMYGLDVSDGELNVLRQVAY